MVTLVRFNHYLVFLFINIIFYFPVFILTNSVPKSSNVNQLTIKVNSTLEETQLQKSLLPNDTMSHESFEKEKIMPSIESQIEKQPQMTAEASHHEPASVHTYHEQDGNSDGYKSHYDHKLSDLGSHHESGKKDSNGKEWDKLKEKERRVKDRGSGFIKAFTWDREEVSKDKYKDKGSEHSHHADHSKGGEYKHNKEKSQHKSSHRDGGKNKSSKSIGTNDHKSSNYKRPPEDHTLHGEVLTYDPNILLYAGNIPSTDEVYIDPRYVGGSLSSPQYYMQPILY